MVATVNVVEGNGATPTWTTKTAIRFCTADNHNPGTDNPVPIPSSGFKYSYWKSIALDLSGTFTQINNVRHYCDSAIGWTLGTSGEVRRGNRDSGDHGCPDGSYDQASGTPGDSGDELGANHSYYSGQTTKTANLASDTEGSPATIDSTDHTSAERTKHIVLQVKVDTDATQGAQSSETFTWKYDEI